jgi:hypothetical protein
MKNAVLALLFGAALGVTTTAQAQQVKQTRSVATFQAVHAGGGVKVVLTPGAATAVVVEATPEVQSQLQTTVKDGALEIGWESSLSLRNNRRATIYVTCPQLTGLAVSGGATAKGATPFTAASFRLSASGGASVDMALAAKDLTSEVSGGGSVYLNGTATRQVATVSGGGSYHAYPLQSTAADVRASSGATAEVQVAGELAAQASSGGSVRYKGGARLTRSQTSSGGSVSPAR